MALLDTGDCRRERPSRGKKRSTSKIKQATDYRRGRGVGRVLMLVRGVHVANVGVGAQSLHLRDDGWQIGMRRTAVRHDNQIAFKFAAEGFRIRTDSQKQCNDVKPRSGTRFAAQPHKKHRTAHRQSSQ